MAMPTTTQRVVHTPYPEVRVITLDPTRVCYDRVVSRLGEMGLSHSITPGVIWLDLPEDDPRRGMIKFEHGPYFTYGAAGSFLAHMDAWKEAAHLRDITLILEDDACIDVGKLTYRLNNLPEEYDVFLLSPEVCPNDGIFELPPGDMRFNTTAGYLVTPIGARKLLRCVCNLEAEGDGWRCVDQVSWQLPIHLEKARDLGAVVLVDGTKPVAHDSTESLTKYVSQP